MRKFLVTVAAVFLLSGIYPEKSLAIPCTTQCFPPNHCDLTIGQCVPVSGGPNVCDPATTADTALGCIPTEPAELVKWVLKYGILMGGGIAFLLSVWGGATILMSSGNPEKIKEGSEVITSAISGLLFIILSVFLLRLIGVDILGLPDFFK